LNINDYIFFVTYLLFYYYIVEVLFVLKFIVAFSFLVFTFELLYSRFMSISYYHVRNREIAYNFFWRYGGWTRWTFRYYAEKLSTCRNSI